MKFLHIGDLHLGRSLGDFDLAEDQKYILDQILDIAKRYAVDAVLVAGDVYDKAVPSEAAVRLFDYFIRRLAEEGLQAFVISGNHDSDERMNFGSSLFRANGIYIAAKYEGELLHLRAGKEDSRKMFCVEEEKISDTEERNENTVIGNGTGEASDTDGYRSASEKKNMLNDCADEVHIYLMPFLKASQVRHYFPEEKIENYEDAVRVVLKKAGVDPAQKNVLVAHQFVAGSGNTVSRAEGGNAAGQAEAGDAAGQAEAGDAAGQAEAGDAASQTEDGDTASQTEAGNAAGEKRRDEAPVFGKERTGTEKAEKRRERCFADPILSGSEGIATRHVGLVEKIGADCFDAFDYVALGHIHSPQAVGRPEVRYSGSPLKYSLSEANHVKSVPVVTLENKGEVQVELVPLQPLRDLRHIRGRRSQLLAEENITAPEDFIYVTLTDEDVIDDAMGIFQQYYPNTVRIEYDNSHSKGLQAAEEAEITPEVPFDELITGFYRQIYGCDISPEERRLMREAAGEAGIEIGEDDFPKETGRKDLSKEPGGNDFSKESGGNDLPKETGRKDLSKELGGKAGDAD